MNQSEAAVHKEYVDAHCHLDLFSSPRSVATEAARHRIHTVAVTNAPFVFAHTVALAGAAEYIHPALGLHPELVETHGSQLPRFLELLPQTRFVGEVGLDYTTTDAAARGRQRRVFEAVLNGCASSRDKIITVHSRRAAKETVAMIGRGFPGAVILHWFTGSPRDLSEALAAGVLFSVNSAMLSSQNGRRLLDAMPRERVLTESDGPFTGPRASPDSPAAMTKTVDSLAKAWRVAPEEARALVAANFHRVVARKDAHP